MKKALITGISGFAGSFLSEHLLSQNHEVSGIYIKEESLKNLDGFSEKLDLIKLDLLDGPLVEKTIGEKKPDLIFHLAALTSPKDSFDAPAETMQNNIKAQLNILEAVRKNSPDTKVLVISSAEIYGRVDEKDLPIDEETKLMPTSPYAVSKITQDFLGLQYFLSYGLKVIRVRPFNHIGPRQSDRFVVGAFAKKIAEIEKGKRDPVLPVGNLKSKRDFTDVRDMVRAYAIAIKNGEIGEVYNLGKGVSHSVSEILDKLLSMSTAEIQVKEDPSLLRPSDSSDLVCDATKFKNISSWEPEIEIDETLKDTLDYWRNII
jgi:GDP-4-dehydro-6-deoxy-D-mannose reductase